MANTGKRCQGGDFESGISSSLEKEKKKVSTANKSPVEKVKCRGGRLKLGEKIGWGHTLMRWHFPPITVVHRLCARSAHRSCGSRLCGHSRGTQTGAKWEQVGVKSKDFDGGFGISYESHCASWQHRKVSVFSLHQLLPGHWNVHVEYEQRWGRDYQLWQSVHWFLFTLWVWVCVIKAKCEHGAT